VQQQARVAHDADMPFQNIRCPLQRLPALSGRPARPAADRCRAGVDAASSSAFCTSGTVDPIELRPPKDRAADQRLGDGDEIRRRRVERREMFGEDKAPSLVTAKPSRESTMASSARAAA